MTCECTHDCMATTAADDAIDFCPLHASAPDLLALAERISRYASLPLDNMSVRERERVAIFQNARAAIRKAKGE